MVDPGDANPVITFLKKHALTLSAILITHHHWDHTNGIEALAKIYDIPVYGPEKEPVQNMTQRLKGGDQIDVDNMPFTLKVLDIPGHTLGHIAYYNDDWLFCGDTLFTGGCGKIFEGTIEQMYRSLTQLAGLGDDLLVYCGHEYTAANLAFAQLLEPDNAALKKRIEAVADQRQQNLPTVPSTLSLEKQTNPFLRCAHRTLIQAAEQYAGKHLATPQEVFGVIREWKNTNPRV